MFSGFTWEGYLSLDAALGDDRPGPRLYFLGGIVELVSTGKKHEELKKWIADLLAQFFLAREVAAYPCGQATIRKSREAGAEPDESWTFGGRRDTPDMVLEIALTSGGLPKLEIYRRLGVREVWFWRDGGLEIWSLNADATGYDGPSKRSGLLKELPVEALEECAEIEDWTAAIHRFREKL
jgi:Uma2 family endonuclease